MSLGAPRPPLADHPVYSRSLEALTGVGTDAGPFASGTVAWLHRIVRVPMWALDDDDLALLLAHGRGLPYTLALALDRLDADPRRGGQRGPGALLLVAAALPDDVWREHPAARARVRSLARRALDGADDRLRDELAVVIAAFTDPPPPTDPAA